jgi:hypothetical protein
VPLLGEAFFISQISAGSPLAAVFFSAARNPRGGGAMLTVRRSVSSGVSRCRAAMRCWQSVTMVSRIVIISPLRLFGVLIAQVCDKKKSKDACQAATVTVRFNGVSVY